MGAGRIKSADAAGRAEDLGALWVAEFATSDLSSTVDHANLLRSVAFAQVMTSGPGQALDTVRSANQMLQNAASAATDADDVFRVREAMFPTLETLSLCEELWGDPHASLCAAHELVQKFPSDSRAWIRLSKSYHAVEHHGRAIEALLRAASTEHTKWLFGVLGALELAVDDAEVDMVHTFALSYGVKKEELEPR